MEAEVMVKPIFNFRPNNRARKRVEQVMLEKGLSRTDALIYLILHGDKDIKIEKRNRLCYK